LDFNLDSRMWPRNTVAVYDCQTFSGHRGLRLFHPRVRLARNGQELPMVL
jgi:hypothetical protein